MSNKKYKQKPGLPAVKYALHSTDGLRWKIDQQGEMRTDGLIFANERLIDDIKNDPCVNQVANVAHLPGIVGPAMAMPDIHWGYGFPIGGVAAFGEDDGVISPGGVGYDINCGVRLLRTRYDLKQVTKNERRFDRLLDLLFENIPSGVGSSRKDVRLNEDEMRDLLLRGAQWMVERNHGTPRDLDFLEAHGCIPGANPHAVSKHAIDRGKTQLGTLGSGNHFCELGYVDEVYDEKTAQVYGLEKDLVTVFIHTGSRGLGYQVCDDYLKDMVRAAARYGIELPDRQLCCAPLSSEEGKTYFSAMCAAANFAFANRQLITDRVRLSFEEAFGVPSGQTGIEIIYDVCHNIAKMETHTFAGTERRVCVHRKGATRAFPPGHPEIPEAYREVGQPVLVPGDMGRYSYVLAGTAGAYLESFGSCCHGAGRRLSRSAAKKKAAQRSIEKELLARGIHLRAANRRTVDEEMPEAYKDVTDVVQSVDAVGIGKLVARIRPIGVIKG